jgi:hypothetical protein
LSRNALKVLQWKWHLLDCFDQVLERALLESTLAPMSNLTGSWNEVGLRAKLRLLRMHYESGVGHVGSNLCCLDMKLVIQGQVLGASDQFVLSKDRSAGVCYVVS